MALKLSPKEAAPTILRSSTVGTLTVPGTENDPASRTFSLAVPVAVRLATVRAAAALAPESSVRSNPAILTAARLMTLVAA